MYRAAIHALMFCGCVGVNGGGLAHYVGQEKLAPMESWSSIAFARDWFPAVRLQNAPSWHYVHTDQWRYEKGFRDYHTVPDGNGSGSLAQGHTIDLQARAVRSAWLPFYPQFNKNPLELVKEAEAAAAGSPEKIADYTVQQLKEGKLKFSVEDPDAAENWPRVWFIWRGNVLMSSGKGHEYFLKHYLGTHTNAIAEDLAQDDVKEVTWHEKAPQGKMDLVVDLNFRMDTSALYSDIVLPAATWYEKVFYNWFTGKSEKCILCFPRIETGQAPACFHSCVGRIRYLGVLLYDAERIAEVTARPNDELIDAYRSIVLDPFDPEVIEAARRNGIHDSVIESAQKSPVYKFVKVWRIALPPHIEFRTLPMLFYVPPMSPVMASKEGATVNHVSQDLFHDIDQARVPMKFLANLFGAGHEAKVRYALRKQKAVRWYRRTLTVGDVDRTTAERMLREAECSVEEAEAIYRLTSLCTFEDRFVIPPSHREEALQMLEDPMEHLESAGFGFLEEPRRGL